MNSVDQNIHGFLASDHRRLDSHLAKAFRNPEHIDLEAYDVFRGGLLWHIAIEKEFLFPTLRQIRNTQVRLLLKTLHSDHGALGAHLVLFPSLERLNRINRTLLPHNRLEE